MSQDETTPLGPLTALSVGCALFLFGCCVNVALDVFQGQLQVADVIILRLAAIGTSAVSSVLALVSLSHCWRPFLTMLRGW